MPIGDSKIHNRKIVKQESIKGLEDGRGSTSPGPPLMVLNSKRIDRT